MIHVYTADENHFDQMKKKFYAQPVSENSMDMPEYQRKHPKLIYDEVVNRATKALKEGAPLYVLTYSALVMDAIRYAVLNSGRTDTEALARICNLNHEGLTIYYLYDTCDAYDESDMFCTEFEARKNVIEARRQFRKGR